MNREAVAYSHWRASYWVELFLGGGSNLKNMCQNGHLPKIGLKIRDV